MTKQNYLITIVGPTAIGKTALSILIAQHFNTEIISCDSRQFYKEMYIGTAVPDAEELRAVKHHFIQHKSIHQSYNVGDFEHDAIKKLDEIYRDHHIAVLVGGSGMYAKAVLEGLDDFPEVAPEVRTALNHRLSEEGILPLQKELKKLDPEAFAKVAVDNPQRLLRALQICIGTGKPYSSFLNKKTTTRNFIPIEIGITAERPVIYDRINQRVMLMLEAGLINEAKNMHPFKMLNALNTVGYKELFQYLENLVSQEEAIDLIKRNTRRFAKRQLTWFKKNKNTTWFDYRVDPMTIIEQINEQIKSHK